MLSFLPNLFYILAFFAGTFVTWKLFRKENYDEEKVIDLVLFSTIVGIFVGRVFYLFPRFTIYDLRFTNLLVSLFLFSNGGLNYDVAIFAFLLFTFYFFRRNKWPIFPALDFLSLGTAVAAAIVEFGLFVSASSIYHLLFTIYSLLITFALFFLHQYYYKKGRILTLALLATLRPLLVLTGVVTFYIIDGKEYVKEFVKGFKEGVKKKLT